MLTAISSFNSLSVDDLKKARRFYIDTLQLPLKDDSMGLTIELPGGGSLFIYEKEDHEPAAYTTVNFVVEDIDDTIQHLTDHHGIKMERYTNLPAEQDELGVLRGTAAGQGPDIAWFTDPAGNVLSIIEE